MTIYDRGVVGLLADLRDTLDSYSKIITDDDCVDIRIIDLDTDTLRDEFLLELVAVAVRHGARDA